MSDWLTGKDISVYQGAWIDTGEQFVMIKMSGGDNGLYMDSQAASNYSGAVSAGKVVGGYHFAGGTDAVAEADYFVRAMSPQAENDIYALDWEVQNPDPVGWCKAFMNEVHAKIGVWPLLYINLSTLNAYDWTPVLTNSGLWLADWAVSPDADAPTNWTYVMQQYTDTPYDKDAFFGTREQLQAYGWHAQAAAPPLPTSPPQPSPVPSTPSAPAPSVPSGSNIDGVKVPVTVKPATPPKVTVVNLPQPSLGDKLAQYKKGIIAFLTVAVAWVSMIPAGSNHYVQLIIGFLGAIGVVAVRNKGL